MKVVQVLMSTYNGEKYLNVQLDSILAQDCDKLCGIQVHLLVRDDGSTDRTQEILQEYAARYPAQITWYQGENVGVIDSFFDLVAHSDEEALYYALADQDDYWEPEKLRAGCEYLNQRQQNDKPYLYCCRPRLVDENLQELSSRIKRPPMRPSFQNALVENVVTGCTIVMNSSLRDMVKANPPQYTVMHDWWFYLVASSFGEIYYDETPHIRYRQHGGNTVGTNVSRYKELKDRVARFKGNRHNISNQLKEFLRIYGDTQTGDRQAGDSIALARALVESKKSLAKRVKLVAGGNIYRQRRGDDYIFRLILLSGSF
jgi:glycosyltransferase involved in cell wall biosynthesis